MNEQQLADELCRLGRSLFERGLSPGRTGNLSARVAGGFLITPTGTSMGDLRPGALSRVDDEEQHVGGPRPSKEAFLHAALYRARPDAGAVAHLHSTYATALSCLDGIDDDDALPSLTVYAALRIGRLRRLPLHPPGDERLGPLAEAAARDSAALLLANHGSIAAGADLASAVDVLEEIEHTAKVHFVLAGHPHRTVPHPGR